MTARAIGVALYLAAAALARMLAGKLLRRPAFRDRWDLLSFGLLHGLGVALAIYWRAIP